MTDKKESGHEKGPAWCVVGALVDCHEQLIGGGEKVYKGRRVTSLPYKLPSGRVVIHIEGEVQAVSLINCRPSEGK